MGYGGRELSRVCGRRPRRVRRPGSDFGPELVRIGARLSPAFPQPTRAQRGAAGCVRPSERPVQQPRRDLCPVRRVRCRRAVRARGLLTLKRIRAIAFVLRAARGEAREPSRRTGASQDVASWLYQQDCNSTASASIYARAAGKLTLGCDGARAAAPIASANTAFIFLAQLANLRPLAPQAASSLRPERSHKFSTLAALGLRERVDQPWERTLSQLIFWFRTGFIAHATRLKKRSEPLFWRDLGPQGLLSSLFLAAASAAPSFARLEVYSWLQPALHRVSRA